MIAKHEKLDQTLEAIVPAELIHFSAGFVFGKWNIWAQLNGYWYRGTDAHISIAFNQMLNHAKDKKSVSRVVSPEEGRIKPDEKLNFEEDF